MNLSKFFRFSRYKLKNFEFIMVLMVLVLSVLSLLILNSAMANDPARVSTLRKQVIGLVAGLIFMSFFALLDYHVLVNLGLVVYIGTVLILIGVLVPGLGVVVNNARRWMNIAGFQIQPSEFAKIGLIIFFAMFFHLFSDEISKLRTVAASLLLIAVPVVLILREPDLSTTLVIAVLFIAMIFTAGISRRWIIGVSLLAVIGMVLAFTVVSNENIKIPFIKDYQINRVRSWVYPEKYKDMGLTLQQDNSMMAIASGQLRGKGLNNTSFESVKNGRFLYEENCDFIFAVIGEELGFIGSSAIILLMLALVIKCFHIGFGARDLSGTLICVGYGTLLAFQSFVNIAVSTKLLPNTGLPLPFLSAGVSSLFSLLVGFGIVLNVGLQRRR